MWYFRTPDGERFPLDEKVELVVEGKSHPVVEIGGVGFAKALTLDLYETQWQIGDGTLGDDAEPVKVLVLQDSFSGAKIEVPIEVEQAEKLAAALAPKSGRSRVRLFRG
jgi:hypothetical protein